MHKKNHLLVIAAFAFVVCAINAKSAGIGEYLTQDGLLAINLDLKFPHEGKPMGVPEGYDWANNPTLHTGNSPGDNTAMTGWGQVFWGANANFNDNLVQFRNFKTLVCYGQNHEWMQLQDGAIEGAQFRADFANNLNNPPSLYSQKNGVTTVGFDQGTAYHFWPKLGQVNLPSKDLCGFLIVLQARVVPNSAAYQVVPKTFLLGLGADYWTKAGSTWNNQKTNPNIAIGRLRYIDSSWSWFGMSTASDRDIEKLYVEGYVLDGNLRLHLGAD